jgi:hypothetical protein
VAAADGDDSIFALDQQFKCTGDRVGIKLASRDDPDKSFAPWRKGVVFGVEYNTQDWTWSIPQEKRSRLLTTLKETIQADEISARQAKSIVGKLIHIKALLPAAKFNISHIMRLAASDADIDLDNTYVAIDASCRWQLWH